MKAEGFVKVLVDWDGEILGWHIVGPDASMLIQEAVAMKSGSGPVETRSTRHSPRWSTGRSPSLTVWTVIAITTDGRGDSLKYGTDVATFQ